MKKITIILISFAYSLIILSIFLACLKYLFGDEYILFIFIFKTIIAVIIGFTSIQISDKIFKNKS